MSNVYKSLFFDLSLRKSNTASGHVSLELFTWLEFKNFLELDKYSDDYFYDLDFIIYSAEDYQILDPNNLYNSVYTKKHNIVLSVSRLKDNYSLNISLSGLGLPDRISFSNSYLSGYSPVLYIPNSSDSSLVSLNYYVKSNVSGSFDVSFNSGTKLKIVINKIFK